VLNLNDNAMAITKQYLKSKPVCKVTFTVPAEEASKVYVVGDFNNWNPKKGTLRKLKNGTFKGTMDLPKEASYEFRYLIDDTYVNEAEADRYQWNEFAGTENAVLEL
jgi:1,4-alpha-glucan branching enzyme